MQTPQTEFDDSAALGIAALFMTKYSHDLIIAITDMLTCCSFFLFFFGIVVIRYIIFFLHHNLFPTKLEVLK